jgi:hypothetical protein
VPVHGRGRGIGLSAPTLAIFHDRAATSGGDGADDVCLDLDLAGIGAEHSCNALRVEGPWTGKWLILAMCSMRGVRTLGPWSRTCRHPAGTGVGGLNGCTA